DRVRSRTRGRAVGGVSGPLLTSWVTKTCTATARGPRGGRRVRRHRSRRHRRALGRVERVNGRRRRTLEPVWCAAGADLEELTNHTEGVLALELAGLSSEHFEALVDGGPAGRGEERALAHSRAALDDDEATLTHRRGAPCGG